ncbi:unnamed protein product [Arctogadus glacialis]
MLWISQRGPGQGGQLGPCECYEVDREEQEEEEEEEEEEGGVERRFLHQQRRVVPTGDGVRVARYPSGLGRPLEKG